MVFSSCGQQSNTTDTGSTDGATATVDISDLKIAYIHTDTVINNYTYFKERSAEIADKGKRFEGELSTGA